LKFWGCEPPILEIEEEAVGGRRWYRSIAVAYTYNLRKVRTHPLSGKYTNLLYLIYELFRSLFKTCSCSIVKLVPDFKAEMHQIQFPLGLRPRPLGELTALHQTP